MLKISNGQIRNISLQQIAEFKKRLRIHIENHFAKITAKLDEEEWQEFLDEGLRRTSLYKLQTESETMQYFNIILTLGADFESNENFPWAARILNDMNKPAKQRMEELNNLVQSELKK